VFFYINDFKLLRAFRTMIEDAWGMDIYQRDDDGGEEQVLKKKFLKNYFLSDSIIKNYYYFFYYNFPRMKPQIR